METTSTYMAVIAGLLVISIFINVLGNSLIWAYRARRTPSGSLSPSEAAMLAYMREEEKLARDIYLTLNQIWSNETFSMSASSKQEQMDLMKQILAEYKLTDPAQEAIGVFSSGDLQARYDQLLATGLQSYIDGLYVAATVEETNSAEIRDAIHASKHLHVASAYRDLLESSKKYLRVFVKALANQGVTYSPKLLSQERYNAIIGL